MPDPIISSNGGVDLTARFIESHAIVGSPAAGTIAIACSLTWSPQSNPTVVNGALLEAAVALTVGTNGVSVLLQIRRTNATGTVIATTGATTAVAATLISLSTQGIDQVAFIPGQIWVACLTIASGSASSTVSAVSMFGTIV
jgi:hypothetical protein